MAALFRDVQTEKQGDSGLQGLERVKMVFEGQLPDEKTSVRLLENTESKNTQQPMKGYQQH